MPERVQVGYKENDQQNTVAPPARRACRVTATTIGIVGLASMVLTSCRSPEPPIPLGNGSGSGAAVGGPGTPSGGITGATPTGGAGDTTTTTGMDQTGTAGSPGIAGQQGAPARGDAGGGIIGSGGRPAEPAIGGASGTSTGGASGTPAMTGGASGTMTGGTSGASTMTGGTSGAMTGGTSGAPTMTGGTSGAMTGGASGAMTGGASGAMTGGASGAMTGGTSGAMTGGTSGAMTGGQAAPTSGTGGASPPSSTGGAPSSTGGSAGVTSGSGGSPSGGGIVGPAAMGGGCGSGAGGATFDSVASDDSAGAAITVRLAGPLSDPGDDFNLPLGTNGRGCATCHVAGQSMSMTPAGIQARFDASDGTDPVFRPVDGAVSPLADVSTADARRNAYALLLSKGLIRVGLPIPANADFDLVAVSDPYGYASRAELSLFRRPLPASNLPFLSAVMWDGREGLITPDDPSNTLLRALASQAGDAVLGHSQASSPLDPSRVAGIVEFEMGIFSAQATNVTAGPLDGAAGLGGPLALAQQTFYPGINDPNGADPTTPFSPNVFTLYVPWQAADPQGSDADARRQIALGEQLFNTRTFSVTGVTGLTTAEQPSVTVTCSTCHDAPGAGSNSSGRFFDLGLASASRAGTDLPVYTLQERSTGTQVQVSDPGRALITGAFKDVATFKVPTLRGLAARGPYFHNGAAATLSNVVGFYNGRFGIGLTNDEKAALAAFLSSL